jgi:tRNA 2-selenouridine synthase
MNPRIVSAQEAIDGLDRFDSILDARSPSEFAEDHLPGAVSLPVLDDEQRALVGTQYKQDAFLARRLGAALVAENIGRHLKGPLAEYPRDWQPLIYCWRGGQRSNALATILARVGWRVTLLDGGYKAFRGRLLELFPGLVDSFEFRVVCGVTGSGKTRFLDALSRAGQQVLDLEGLACHRGSLLGAMPHAPQPSQRQFETQIWNVLRKLDPARPVFVESESKKVGNVQIPDALMLRIRGSACFTLELSLQDRVSLLCEEYGHFFESPEPLRNQLHKLLALVGHEQVNRWIEEVDQGRWRQLVESLLALHYDPSYLRSIDRNFPQRVRGQTIQLEGYQPSDYDAAASSLSL